MSVTIADYTSFIEQLVYDCTEKNFISEMNMDRITDGFRDFLGKARNKITAGDIYFGLSIISTMLTQVDDIINSTTDDCIGISIIVSDIYNYVSTLPVPDNGTDELQLQQHILEQIKILDRNYGVLQ